MNTKRIFVVGSRGQLGHDLMDVLEKSFDLIGADLPEIDITNSNSLSKMICKYNPNIIVNSAAFTDVDGCEMNLDTARAVNVDGPRNLARIAQFIGAKLIHVSTDYVFNGRKKIPVPYTEMDSPDPMTSYGRTKLEGERAAQIVSDRVVIIRTAWLYGVHGDNFIKKILRLALQDTSGILNVVNDQHGSPTWSKRLAEQIAGVITHGSIGLYHATGQGHCTWYTLACTFLDLMKVKHTISPCTTAQSPLAAQRPANSILENTRLSEEGINRMPHWEKDLKLFVKLYRDTLLEEASKAV